MKKKHLNVFRICVGILLPVILLTMSCSQKEEKEDAPKYKNPNLPVEKRVEDLLTRMTLEAARESIVLLKNENDVLPIDQNKIKTLAVIGPNATEARTGGGGSSKVTPFYSVSSLEGLKKAVGDKINIRYALGIAIRGDIHPLSPGYMIPADTSGGKNGLWGEYFANTELKGEPVLERVDEKIGFNWGYDLPDPKL